MDSHVASRYIFLMQASRRWWPLFRESADAARAFFLYSPNINTIYDRASPAELVVDRCVRADVQPEVYGRGGAREWVADHQSQVFTRILLNSQLAHIDVEGIQKACRIRYECEMPAIYGRVSLGDR
jgi:hypothetical protein